MNLKRKIAVAAALGTLFLNSVTAGAFAATTLTITGNGSGSNNSSSVNTSSTTTVVQQNSANVSNNITTASNTGGNHANDNTGGNISVSSGRATSNVDVSTMVNHNRADVANCACASDATVTVSGNGSGSQNNATLSHGNTTEVFQTNDARINNMITTTGRTGNNDANRNTGGTVSVASGNADSTVSVRNAANANIATVGGGASSGTGRGTTTVDIVGNGSGSNNTINLRNDSSMRLIQSNGANITNDITTRGATGSNRANDNTGGNVTVTSGGAVSDVMVDTMANFNGADISNCLCTSDVTAKISGNGSRSRSLLTAALDGNTAFFQTGDANVNNMFDTIGRTGGSSARRNTGDAGIADFRLTSGNANSMTKVHTMSNMNMIGNVHIPTLHFGNMDFSFDLGGMSGFLHFLGM